MKHSRRPGVRLVVLAGDHFARAVVRVALRACLVLAFVLVLTPLGLIRRALGHDPLGRRRRPNTDTYYLPLVAPGEPTPLAADVMLLPGAPGRLLHAALGGFGGIARWSGLADRSRNRVVNVYTLF